MTQIDQTQKFIMRGSFGANSFIPWMERHARKLGLEERIIAASPERIEMAVKGPSALIDAMEVACLLGPIDIWVDDIECLPLENMPPDRLAPRFASH
ncbi:acylphosphatase [Martelella soudanensis]|uniref:acylphosphatase n=1 Tax=unclassified Martelella TaxID=2629616 RepID=UPI001FEF801B|nr:MULTISPECIES: acylphosphatase [unclassified Martelella]